MAPSGYTSCGLFEISGRAVAVSGGQVKCWGKNGSRALGRGEVITDNTADNYSAENVLDVNTAIAISGERQAFCGLLFNRTVKCWGDNPNGKASVGALGTSGTPRLMRTGNLSSAAIEDIYAVSVGGTHICIIIGLTGNVKCSGSNSSGQLGDGTITASAVNMVTVTDTTGSGSLTGAGADNMPPAYSSSAVNAEGTKVILTYDEVLSAAGTIPTGLFTVKVGGVTKTISSVTVNGLTVELDMAERIAPGAVVRLSYGDPTTNGDDSNVLEDASFNDSSSIPEAQITNGSTTEAVAPTLVSAAIDATGEFLTLTYSEALGTTTAATTAFSVTYGGSSRTPTARSVSGSTVVLTLSPRVQRTDTVTVAYTAPTADLGTTNTAVQDTAGNDAASFSATSATNSSTYDTVAPTFVSAAMNGLKTKVVLTYDEDLGATTAGSGAFGVSVNSSSRGVTGVSISGSTVELTLASSVNEGETVTFTYTAPGVSAATSNSAIQDLAGNDAASVSSATSVTNITDVTAPVRQSAVVNAAGTSLTLTYNEALGSTTAATGDFVVRVGGSTRSVTGVAVSGSTVVLTLSPVVQQNEEVTVAYTAPASNSSATNNAIQDSVGNDAVSFTALAVTNNSTTDTVSPTLVSTAVNAAGAAVLTFSETLGTTGPSASAFTVTVDGATLTVTGVTIVGATVVIVTSPKIEAGKAATIVYNAPSSSSATSNSAIQDATGNDAAGATFTVTSANNASTYDPTPPTSTGSEVNDGGKLVITYSETLATPGPDASQFTVTIDGKTATIVSVEIVDNKIVITTSPLIAGGETVTWAFTDATSGNDAKGIQDAAGNDVGSGTNGSGSVTNGSKVSNVDPVPPTVSGSEVNEGGKVVISFSETLAAPGPDSSQFTVTIDGSPVTIVSVEVIDNKVIITTAPLVADGQTVTWKYADPTAGNDQKAIQDKSGNDLGSASIGSGSVTNGSKVTKEAAEVEEDPATTMLSDEVTVDGVSGTATFGDGSQIVVSGKFLKIRFKTGYIGNAGGTVTGTYLVGKKKTKYKCTVASFGTAKKNPTAKRIYPSKKMGLWFKKKIYTPKTPCVMPTAMQTALKTQRITLTVKLNFKRLWPNTAKAIDDEGKRIPPAKRIMKLKIGKAPTK